MCGWHVVEVWEVCGEGCMRQRGEGGMWTGRILLSANGVQDRKGSKRGVGGGEVWEACR